MPTPSVIPAPTSSQTNPSQQTDVRDEIAQGIFDEAVTTYKNNLNGPAQSLTAFENVVQHAADKFTNYLSDPTHSLSSRKDLARAMLEEVLANGTFHFSDEHGANRNPYAAVLLKLNSDSQGSNPLAPGSADPDTNQAIVSAMRELPSDQQSKIYAILRTEEARESDVARDSQASEPLDPLSNPITPGAANPQVGTTANQDLKNFIKQVDPSAAQNANKQALFAIIDSKVRHGDKITEEEMSEFSRAITGDDGKLNYNGARFLEQAYKNGPEYLSKLASQINADPHSNQLMLGLFSRSYNEDYPSMPKGRMQEVIRETAERLLPAVDTEKEQAALQDWLKVTASVVLDEVSDTYVPVGVNPDPAIDRGGYETDDPASLAKYIKQIVQDGTDPAKIEQSLEVFQKLSQQYEKTVRDFVTDNPPKDIKEYNDAAKKLGALRESYRNGFNDAVDKIIGDRELAGENLSKVVDPIVNTLIGFAAAYVTGGLSTLLTNKVVLDGIKDGVKELLKAGKVLDFEDLASKVIYIYNAKVVDRAEAANIMQQKGFANKLDESVTWIHPELTPAFNDGRAQANYHR